MRIFGNQLTYGMCYNAWRDLADTTAKRQILRAAKSKVKDAFELDFDLKLRSNNWEDHSQSTWDTLRKLSFCISIAVGFID